MKNVIAYFVSVMLMSTTLLGGRTNKTTNTITIKYNKENFKRADSKKSRKKTGHSPVKPRSFSVDSPEKAKYIKNVLVKNRISKKQKPQSARALAFIEETEEAIQEYQTIFKKHDNFSAGKWAFVDPRHANATVCVNSDNEQWDSLINAEFLPVLKKIDDPKYFIGKVIYLINKNISKIRPLVISVESKDGNFVCRHFATLSLTMFSKLLTHEDIFFSGSVGLISADFFDKNWETPEAGHVWNIINLKNTDDKKNNQVWLFDTYNRGFVNLSASENISEHQLIKVNNSGKLFTKSLSENASFLDWVECTMDKYELRTNKNNCYQQEETMKIINEKILKNFPLKKITQETVKIR